MLQTFLAVAKKEIVHTLRDRGTLRTLVFTQLIQMFMLGFLDMTARDLPLVVVDNDHTSHSREFLEKLRATQTVRLEYFAQDTTQAREMIRAGRARVAIVIPSDFHERRVAGKGAKILTMVDGSDAAASGQALIAINGLTAQMSIEGKTNNVGRARSLPLSARGLVLFNPQGRTANYMLPALLAILLQTYMSLTANALVRERTAGTMDRLMMTPIDTTGMLLGKTAPFVASGMLNVLLILGLMRWVFSVPIHGSAILLFASTLIYIIDLLAIGLLFGSTARTFPEVGQKAALFTFVPVFLSGYILPLEGMPAWLRPFAYLMPQTHMVEISRAIVLRDAHLVHLLPHLAYLALLPIVIIWRANTLFRRTIQA